MKNINRIFKWVMWALIGISVILLIWGFAVGFESKDGAAVDTLLRWAYVMVGIAVAAVVVFGLVIGTINNPKSLIKLGVGIVAIAAICFVVYLISPGAPAMGMAEQKPHSVLRLTDTVLNLTYLAGGLAILSILFSAVWGSIRK